jgi:pimeloyl-ACP methyl ester carboxylesterase
MHSQFGRGAAIHPDMPAPDWAATGARAGVPITYLWGTEDRFVPVESGRRLASDIGANLHEIPEAGHLVWLDQPETTVQTVRTVLGVTGPGASANER